MAQPDSQARATTAEHEADQRVADPTRAERVASGQDRANDRGHFNLYGMRDDARGPDAVDGENPGTGEGPRRFGGGGDEASYANLPPADDGQRPVGQVAGPVSAVDASGSARALGMDYGGERHKEPRLSSRQGAELIGELDRERIEPTADEVAFKRTTTGT